MASFSLRCSVQSTASATRGVPSALGEAKRPAACLHAFSTLDTGQTPVSTHITRALGLTTQIPISVALSRSSPMSIRVALYHRSSYSYDRLVTLGPQVIRLRPAPQTRTTIESHSLKIQPAKHFIHWQQDP